MCTIESFLNSGENKEEIIDSIEKLQRDCIQYVIQLSREQISELIEQNNYFFVRNSNGEIVASGYVLPLLDSVNEDNQIYKLGGLSIKDFTSSSTETKKNALTLLKKIKDYFETKNSQLIMTTRNPVISKFLITMDVEELSYLECLKKYPTFLISYIEKSEKSEEYYKEQTFYIRTKK